MFDALFGWRKASKCKKLIRRVQRRLRLLRSKRDSIARNLRGDVSRLVEMGYLEIATERAEQLLKDESVLEMYDLLNGFCELVVANMSYIRRHRECPDDICEAVSSLIFASARCGELPELRRIRELFGKRYGERFALVAVDLLPGNLVNPKIREQLSMKAMSNHSKFEIIDEFAGDQLGTQPEETLAIEYASELHKKIEEMAEQQAACLEMVPISPVIAADSKQVEIGTSKAEKTAEAFHSVEANNGQEVEKSQSPMMLLMKSASPKVGRFAIAPSPTYELNATVRSTEERKALKSAEGAPTSSSGESSPQFTDLKVVYLDDVEEVQSSRKLDGEGLDQRLFKFKPPAVPKIANPEDMAPDDGDMEQYQSSGKDDSTRRASRRSKLPSGKRFRRRSVSREPEIIDDVEYAVYYNSPPGNPRKHPKQSPTDARNRSVASNPKNDQHEPRKESSPRHCNCCECRKAGNREVLHAKKSRRKQDVDPSDTDSSTSSSLVEVDRLLPRYARAITMPPKRQTARPDCEEGKKIPRSNSSPFGQQQPNHVHPKLPDYEELAAKFSALKKEFLEASPKPNRASKHV